jgi:hypothetical protein
MKLDARAFGLVRPAAAGAQMSVWANNRTASRTHRLSGTLLNLCGAASAVAIGLVRPGGVAGSSFRPCVPASGTRLKLPRGAEDVKWSSESRGQQCSSFGGGETLHTVRAATKLFDKVRDSDGAYFFLS